MKNIVIALMFIIVSTGGVLLAASHVLHAQEIGAAQRTLSMSEVIITAELTESQQTWLHSSLRTEYCIMRNNSDLLLFRWTLRSSMVRTNNNYKEFFESNQLTELMQCPHT